MLNTKLSSNLKRLFSPGPVQLEYKLDLVFSHRSDEFKQLYRDTCASLLLLSGYKNVVMTQGSATSAIESVLSSVLKPSSKLLILVNGEFGRRANQIASLYTQSITAVSNLDSLISSLETGEFDFCFVVMFETSLSIYNETKVVEKICKFVKTHLIVDAVSAFPYYETSAAKFFITTSSKQLRGLPAMGLIFYNDIGDLELLERSDYLNLRKHIEYAKNNQTPHTSLIPQLDSLNKALRNLDVSALRLNIARNSACLIKGLEDRVINESICPVITLQTNDPAKLVSSMHSQGISIYQNLTYMKQCIQIGCFNYDDEKAYIDLNRLLLKELSKS